MITNVDTYEAKQLVGNFQTRIEIPMNSFSPVVLSKIKKHLEFRYLPNHSYRGKASILTRALLNSSRGLSPLMVYSRRYIDCPEHASEDMQSLFVQLVSTDVATYRLNGHDLGSYYTSRYNDITAKPAGKFWILNAQANKNLGKQYIAANKKHIDSRFRAQADLCDMLLERLVVGKSLVFNTY